MSFLTSLLNLSDSAPEARSFTTRLFTDQPLGQQIQSTQDLLKPVFAEAGTGTLTTTQPGQVVQTGTATSAGSNLFDIASTGAKLALKGTELLFPQAGTGVGATLTSSGALTTSVPEVLTAHLFPEAGVGAFPGIELGVMEGLAAEAGTASLSSILAGASIPASIAFGFMGLNKFLNPGKTTAQAQAQFLKHGQPLAAKFSAVMASNDPGPLGEWLVHATGLSAPLFRAQTRPINIGPLATLLSKQTLQAYDKLLRLDPEHQSAALQPSQWPITALHIWNALAADGRLPTPFGQAPWAPGPEFTAMIPVGTKASEFKRYYEIVRAAAETAQEQKRLDDLRFASE